MSELPTELDVPDNPREALSADHTTLLESLLAGEQRGLARVLTIIENREPGSRALLAALYAEAGSTPVLGITGSPGAGKSTLVDKLTDSYRKQGETVGILAVDPSSPYTGGSVLGDRIRMGSTAGDEGVFIRSMSARGRLGGLSMATTDAVTALDAFGMDRIIIETVGAGQNEVDIVETADTVAVVVQPGAGDDVQLLKAGILEIGDIFVVNKADTEGAAQTAADLEAMVHGRQPTTPTAGHHAPDTASTETDDHSPVTTDDSSAAPTDNGSAATTEDSSAATDNEWTPPVVETIATTGDGVEAFSDAIASHNAYLDSSGGNRRRQRAAATLKRLLRHDLAEQSEQLIESHGGIETLAAAVADRQTDPYSLVKALTTPISAAVDDTLDND